MEQKKVQPEALAQFAEAARKDIHGETAPRSMEAKGETKPLAAPNKTKHEVAEKLLSQGARGEEPDPQSAGEDRLPDRTRSTINRK